LKESDTCSLEVVGVETAVGAREGVETEREVGVMVAAATERVKAEAEREKEAAEREKEVEAREAGETETAAVEAVKESMKCPK